jgi:hypothetical protein
MQGTKLNELSTNALYERHKNFSREKERQYESTEGKTLFWVNNDQKFHSFRSLCSDGKFLTGKIERAN